MNYGNDANCKGFWPMECDGDELDLSGEGGTLIETSGDIPLSGDRKFGLYSRDFERVDSEYLTHADGLSTDIHGADQNISIVAWFKPESLGSVYNALVSKYFHPDKRQYCLWITSLRKPCCRLSPDGDTVATALGASNFTDGVWNHIAGAYNDTDIRIYLDGSLDSNGNDNPKAYSGGISDESAEFDIGTRANHDINADGLIDDVAVFDRELTSVEISDIYTNGVAGPGIDPYPVARLRKDVLTGYHCFLGAYVDAERKGYDPLKLPDGTVF